MYTRDTKGGIMLGDRAGLLICPAASVSRAVTPGRRWRSPGACRNINGVLPRGQTQQPFARTGGAARRERQRGKLRTAYVVRAESSSFATLGMTRAEARKVAGLDQRDSTMLSETSCWSCWRESQHEPGGMGAPWGHVRGWPRKVQIFSVASGERMCSNLQACSSIST
jgi:hypothetical protein